VLVLSRFGNQDVASPFAVLERAAEPAKRSKTIRGRIRILSDGLSETRTRRTDSVRSPWIFPEPGSIEVCSVPTPPRLGNAAGCVVNIRSNTSFESRMSATHPRSKSRLSQGMLQVGARVGTGNLGGVLGNTKRRRMAMATRAARSPCLTALQSQSARQRRSRVPRRSSNLLSGFPDRSRRSPNDTMQTRNRPTRLH